MVEQLTSFHWQCEKIFEAYNRLQRLLLFNLVSFRSQVGLLDDQRVHGMHHENKGGFLTGQTRQVTLGISKGRNGKMDRKGCSILIHVSVKAIGRLPHRFEIWLPFHRGHRLHLLRVFDIDRPSRMLGNSSCSLVIRRDFEDTLVESRQIL